MTLFGTVTVANTSLTQTTSSPVKNIVLVHGAGVDGSGWNPVYDTLVEDGYTVTVVQEPLTSFADDVAATRRVLCQQQSPLHSRGPQLWRLRHNRGCH